MERKRARYRCREASLSPATVVGPIVGKLSRRSFIAVRLATLAFPGRENVATVERGGTGEKEGATRFHYRIASVMPDIVRYYEERKARIFVAEERLRERHVTVWRGVSWRGSARRAFQEGLRAVMGKEMENERNAGKIVRGTNTRRNERATNGERE